MTQPVVSTAGQGLFTRVEGTFYRAIDPRYRDHAITGSRLAARYSRADQPTLYLSASPEGVEVAMQSHQQSRSGALQIITVAVQADRIFDLRDAAARDMAGISLAEATAPWQDLVARGEAPPSWSVRERLERLGAQGLIDPSRRAPGLWHLAIFTWNRAGAAQAVVIEGD